MLQLDHLVVTAADLDRGVAEVEAALGVRLAPGGKHDAMGTHNRLLRLGAGVYLEVIAIDPAAPAPGQARWFGLDKGARHTRLSHWAARTSDLDRVLAEVPLPLGAPLSLTRGDYSWRMAVTGDGELPFGGAAPALLEWQGTAHPAAALPDVGCRLKHLTVSHPQMTALRAAFPALEALGQVRLEQGRHEISAEIETPSGCWTLA